MTRASPDSAPSQGVSAKQDDHHADTGLEPEFAFLTLSPSVLTFSAVRASSVCKARPVVMDWPPDHGGSLNAIIKATSQKIVTMYRVGLFAALPFSLAAPVLAITCHGDYQVVNGQEISAPFCRDNALAAVARESGFHVSDAEIRNNPAKKEEVCRYLRSDIRVHTACAEVLPNDGGQH